MGEGDRLGAQRPPCGCRLLADGAGQDRYAARRALGGLGRFADPQAETNCVLVTWSGARSPTSTGGWRAPTLLRTSRRNWCLNIAAAGNGSAGCWRTGNRATDCPCIWLAALDAVAEACAAERAASATTRSVACRIHTANGSRSARTLLRVLRRHGYLASIQDGKEGAPLRWTLTAAGRHARSNALMRQC